MILSKTPLRMSFVGGGTDLPSFYQQGEPGAVVSTAIDKYVYVAVNRKFDDAVRVSYSRTEEVANSNEVEHPLVRETLRLLGIPGGIEITSVADIPAKGTGLGSSSSFTVGLLHALSAFKGSYISPADLAERSCHIEISLCGEPIGKQDQYAAAYGGFNFIQFHPNESVSVQPIICRPDTLRQLESNLLVFYTGRTRSASALLAEQADRTRSSRKTTDALRRMAALASVLKTELEGNNLGAFGEILHENWELKKTLASGVSDELLDGCYAAARSAGAVGGKLLGAGQSGFLLFYVPADRAEAVRRALDGLRPAQFRFESSGSKIAFYEMNQ